MRDASFDFLARRTVAALDRRSVFGVLGGVLAASVIAAPEGETKSKKCKGANKKCRSQTVDFCAQAPTEEEAAECRKDLFACCGKTALQCTGVKKFLVCCHKAGWPC